LEVTRTLLEEGGAGAVTLRGVGEAAGVSRGAPYRHFRNKEDLLNAAAAQGWAELEQRMAEAATGHKPTAALGATLSAYLNFARGNQHLYRLMFGTSAGESAELAEAVDRARATYVTIVAGVVGEERSAAMGGIVLAAIHGVADLELRSHLPPGKWGVGADDLVRLIVDTVAQ
jgi:AcrR family transcriptional regulator